MADPLSGLVIVGGIPYLDGVIVPDGGEIPIVWAEYDAFNRPHLPSRDLLGLVLLDVP